MTFQAELDVLKGNPELLESLLINLIDNGIKACESGGCVQVKAYRDGEKAVLSVSDNGRGIPPEELGRVREAFYRVDKARSRKEGGAGLGLSLCEQIADIHQRSWSWIPYRRKAQPYGLLFHMKRVSVLKVIFFLQLGNKSVITSL